MASKIPPLPLEGINGGLDWGILVGKRPGYAYSDGKRQGDIPISQKYHVLLPGNCLNPLTVTIEGSADKLPSVTDEIIANSCASLQFVLVRLTDCKVSVYATDGIKLSATARSIELVKASK